MNLSGNFVERSVFRRKNRLFFAVGIGNNIGHLDVIAENIGPLPFDIPGLLITLTVTGKIKPFKLLGRLFRLDDNPMKKEDKKQDGYLNSHLIGNRQGDRKSTR